MSNSYGLANCNSDYDYDDENGIDENDSNDDDGDATFTFILISNFDHYKKEYLNFIFWKIRIYDSEWSNFLIIFLIALLSNFRLCF